MDKGKEARSEFIITGGDPSELLELEEELFLQDGVPYNNATNRHIMGQLRYPWEECGNLRRGQQ